MPDVPRASRASARATSGSSPTLLARHIGADFNAETFQTDIAVLSGLDRYETITWRFVKNAAGENGVLVQARPKPYGPPFMMLGLNLENTTSEDFRVTFTGRYLAFDVLGSGSELRIDGTLGIGSRAWRSPITGRLAARRCSSSRTPASSIAPST